MSDRVSVIIPVFNSENTIIDALNSVKNQTFFQYIEDIVVVDDGSTDLSLNIVRTYANRNKKLPIKILEESNHGVSYARNRGIENSKGNWIAFLDSDDEWLPNRLERQFEEIYRNPDIDFIGANSDENKLKILFRNTGKLYKANIHDLTIKFFPCTPSVLMKRKIFDEIGGFNENRKYAEDGQYFMRICSKYNYFHLNEHLVNIGHGKMPFGEKGLSSQLKNMHIGNVMNITELRDNNYIGNIEYLFLIIFYNLKYVRRKLITIICNRKISIC